jgi:hypothetical protein
MRQLAPRRRPGLEADVVNGDGHHGGCDHEHRRHDHDATAHDDDHRPYDARLPAGPMD